MARTSWKQVRLEESLYREASIVAAADGRSLTNWIEHMLKPIVASELGTNGAVEQGPGTTRMASDRSPGAARASAVPPARPAPARSPRNPALTRQANLNKAKGL
jgi:hypothetical protein